MLEERPLPEIRIPMPSEPRLNPSPQRGPQQDASSSPRPGVSQDSNLQDQLANLQPGSSTTTTSTIITIKMTTITHTDANNNSTTTTTVTTDISPVTSNTVSSDPATVTVETREMPPQITPVNPSESNNSVSQIHQASNSTQFTEPTNSSQLQQHLAATSYAPQIASIINNVASNLAVNAGINSSALGSQYNNVSTTDSSPYIVNPSMIASNNTINSVHSPITSNHTPSFHNSSAINSFNSSPLPPTHIGASHNGNSSIQSGVSPHHSSQSGISPHHESQSLISPHHDNQSLISHNNCQSGISTHYTSQSGISPHHNSQPGISSHHNNQSGISTHLANQSVISPLQDSQPETSAHHTCQTEMSSSHAEQNMNNNNNPMIRQHHGVNSINMLLDTTLTSAIVRSPSTATINSNGSIPSPIDSANGPPINSPISFGESTLALDNSLVNQMNNPLNISQSLIQRTKYHNLPDLDTLDTVYDVWNEWNVGLDGNPSIITLLEVYGNKWAGENKDTLIARKKIIKEIQTRTNDIGVDKAISEMERLRNGNGLTWLSKKFGGKKKATPAHRG
ncbi:23071_t:CDS:2 [Dentiscutata erythropus]|uniref:23071_t:CDS:1 n=1 Tax=Dentiscutata erythropus TaxID=1348616 RepID=A0A9N9NAJ6_9GLOM|nr:23071_t:CDS:2 [Dentiscutata erythropus]